MHSTSEQLSITQLFQEVAFVFRETNNGEQALPAVKMRYFRPLKHKPKCLSCIQYVHDTIAHTRVIKVIHTVLLSIKEPPF
jgi:hypothetical protein